MDPCSPALPEGMGAACAVHVRAVRAQTPPPWCERERTAHRGPGAAPHRAGPGKHDKHNCVTCPVALLRRADLGQRCEAACSACEQLAKGAASSAGRALCAGPSWGSTTSEASCEAVRLACNQLARTLAPHFNEAGAGATWQEVIKTVHPEVGFSASKARARRRAAARERGHLSATLRCGPAARGALRAGGHPARRSAPTRDVCVSRGCHPHRRRRLAPPARGSRALHRAIVGMQGFIEVTE